LFQPRGRAAARRTTVAVMNFMLVRRMILCFYNIVIIVRELREEGKHACPVAPLPL
jgi:hypothetical protein